MPLYQFGLRNHEYVRRRLMGGGSFWQAFVELPIESGRTFAYLPANCPEELATRVEEAVLGGFDDTNCFREEEEFILQHLRRKRGNAAIVGVNLSDRMILSRKSQFTVVPAGSSSQSYYDHLLILPRQPVTQNEIRDALTLAASPFVFAALLETHKDNPAQWIEDQGREARHGALITYTRSLILDAYRGEGLLFWSAPADGRPD